ncbi:hypothetical protein [Hyalangium rubrum]|uniref:Lipoprotein n=1 Tax=Hyalangium rubrum TaxID=3103134 RepID=A0ABU5H071_9BACT|nr:hypothetical protein [Hyalangium sp. s54d21]MDY7226834.1 hypothetical protein [Hyalangium sp. s54d21]
MKSLFRRAMLAVVLAVPLLFATPSQACGPECGEEPLREDVEACLAGNLGDLARQGPMCRAVGFLLMRGPSAADREHITLLAGTLNVYPGSNTSPWTEARQKVPVPPPEGTLGTEVELADTWFFNCLTGAFEMAAMTLEERIAKFGANSPEVAGWVRAQDAVFQNCSGETRVLPEPAPAEAPPLVRADRAYQTAAALFYAREYEEAVRHLDAIAQDKGSPWSGWARLVAVRALIRQSTVKAQAEAEKRALLEKARERCVAIVKEPALKDLHRQTRQLTWFIDYRLRPDKQLNVLGRVLLEKPDVNFSYAWRDYFLLRRTQGPSDDELSVFLDTFDKPDTYPQALERWKKTGAVSWLVAALSRAQGNEPELAELVARSQTVPKSSPASLSLSAARGRLALKMGRVDEARKELLPLLEAGGTPLPPMTLRPLVGEVREAALTIEEWAKYAHLSPERAGAFLDGGVPLSRFKDTKLLGALSAELRKAVVVSGWTRAVLLERWEEEKALEPHLEKVAPELAADLARVKARTQPEERKMAAVLLLLKAPGMSPYVRPYRAQAARDYDICGPNGWCGKEAADVYQDCDASKGPCGTRYISVAERQEARQEREALKTLGKSPDLLIRFTLDYAKRHPTDALVPEALHESVRQTRFSRTTCEDAEVESRATSELSKQAFQLLQRKYAKTEWAKKTPYHF